MPGIVDVARKAGVSITTVSRTFNPVSDYPVAQATRQRVLAAAAALTPYLLRLGHRRMGFLGGLPSVSPARERIAGFRAGMAAAGLSAELVEDGDFTYTGGQAAAARLLKHAPTAIFAANDQM